MLADAGGEDEAVEAAERARQCADFPADAKDEEVYRLFRMGIGARKQRAHIARQSAGDAEEAGATVKKILDLRDVEALFHAEDGE